MAIHPPARSPHASLLRRPLSDQSADGVAGWAVGLVDSLGGPGAGRHTNAALARRLHISLSAVEKNLNAVFDELGLAHSSGYNRRVLAVLRYLEG